MCWLSAESGRGGHPGPGVPAASGRRSHAAEAGDPAGAEDQGGGGAAATSRHQPQECVRRGGTTEGVEQEAGPAALGTERAQRPVHGHGARPDLR